jgi:hypothetical protein
MVDNRSSAFALVMQSRTKPVRSWAALPLGMSLPVWRVKVNVHKPLVAAAISEVPRSIGDTIRIIRGTWSDLRQGDSGGGDAR